MKSENLAFMVLYCFSQSCTTPVNDPLPKENNSTVAQEEWKEPRDYNINDDVDSSSISYVSDADVELSNVEKDIETAVEITQTIVEAGNEILDTKRRKDSLKLSRKGKMLAYQLGVSFKNEKLALKAYSELNDKEYVCVFKRGRKEYLLVKCLNRSETEFDEELEAYKKEYEGDVIGEIKKIDLVIECGTRNTPRLVKIIKSRKNEIQVDCLSCK